MLAYRLVDQELPRLIGARLGMPADVVESLENRAPGFAERLLAGLSSGVSEIAQPAVGVDDDLLGAYRREVERLMHAAADDDDVVILGRFGNAILAGYPAVVRVFLYAPLPWRIARVRESLGCDQTAARREIDRIDEASRRLGRELYNVEWGALRNYDVAVNTARCGVEGSARLIAAAVLAASPAA